MYIGLSYKGREKIIISIVSKLEILKCISDKVRKTKVIIVHIIDGEEAGGKSKALTIKGRVFVNNSSFISYICEGKCGDPCYGKDSSISLFLSLLT